jgi:ubiquinone/menaquinone biosynthesis C-methylase UbiE
MDAAVHRSPQTERGEFVSDPPSLGAAVWDGSGRRSLASLSEPSLVDAEEGYERWAPTYDRFPNPLLAREERHLVPLLPNLAGKRVLDLACGTGRWLQKLLAQGACEGVGVDYSGAMLRVARGKAATDGRLVRADCRSLPFHSSVFDFVMCSFALGHIRNLRSVVLELARVMNTESELFVSDLHPEAHARGWRTGFRDQSSSVQIEMLPRSAEEVVRTFHGGGFECLTHVALCLGSAEKDIFVSAGRSQLFEEACRLPAVLICHFKLKEANNNTRNEIPLLRSQISDRGLTGDSREKETG